MIQAVVGYARYWCFKSLPYGQYNPTVSILSVLQSTPEMSDDDDNMDIQYDDPYQSDPEQDEQAQLEDIYDEAKELLRKEKWAEAIDKFKHLIDQSNKAGSKDWVAKSWDSIMTVRCKENSPEVIATISGLVSGLEGIPKKEAETTIKSAVDNLKSLTDKDLYRKGKQTLVQEIEKKSDDNVKLRAYLKIAEQDLLDNELKDCKIAIEKIKQMEIDNKFPPEKLADLKLEVCCLEIQYLQKMNSDPQEIKNIIKGVQSLKAELNDSRVNAIIKQNIGKMLVHDGQYQKASKQLLDAFKEYTAIGDIKAKTMLKYATFTGMLSKQQINPFSNVQAQIYTNHDDVKCIQRLRTAFQKHDMPQFKKEVQSEHISGDPFFSPLIATLTQIVHIENLKMILKPYERVGFDYLSKIIKVSAEKVRQFVFQLIVEGEVRGQINSIEGYFEKDKGYDSYMDQEENIMESYIKYLTTTS